MKKSPSPSLLALFCVLQLLTAGIGYAAGPSTAEYQANWPRFRGPDGGGVCSQYDLPLTCDVNSGENVLWSVEVPAGGYGSPVIWGHQVFLSGGAADKRVVMSFDLESGKKMWASEVPKPAAAGEDKGKLPDEANMAAATVATDGQRVYAIFANGDVAALDFGGKIVWTRSLGVPSNTYGHAASLLTWGDKVVVPFDQGEQDENLSKLFALDGKTGAVVWEVARPVGSSWATPIVVEAAGKTQLITNGLPWVIAYNPDDGAELWRAECLDGEIAPSPVFAGGLVFAVSPGSKVQTIRADGSGDVTSSHLGWIAEDGVPDITSPVCDGQRLFLVDSGGIVTCYDAKTGRKQWEHDVEEECNASPSLAGGHLIVLTKQGTLFVLAAGNEFQELGRSALGEEVLASPAFAGNRMIVRGVKHLWCIGRNG